MPLTRKGSDILEAMRSHYGDKKGTNVFYASINKGTVTGAEAGGPHQTHHVPVTGSPFHSLRPPAPQGAHKAGGHEFIPAGSRGVLLHPPTHTKDLPGHMETSAQSHHAKLAHEVAGGLRRFTFAQVAKQQPQQRLQSS